VHPEATLETELVVRTPNPPRKVHPVVFVHGAWHGAWCWDEYFLEYFVGHGYQVYALSFRHHGSRTGPKSLRRSRIADYVGDLAALTTTLAVQPILWADWLFKNTSRRQPHRQECCSPRCHHREPCEQARITNLTA